MAPLVSALYIINKYGGLIYNQARPPPPLARLSLWCGG